DSHRAIGRGEGLFLCNHRALGKRLERGRDQAEGIERKLELRSRRARLDLLTQALKAIANFVWLQDRYCLVESSRFQVEQQRHGDRLQIANTFGRGHWRTCEHAGAPWLLAQAFREHRRELVQLIYIVRIANQRERQLTRLLKIVVVDL